MADMTHTRIPQPASRPLSVRERAKALAAAQAARDLAIEIHAGAASVYRENGMTSSASALEGVGKLIGEHLDLDVVLSHL